MSNKKISQLDSATDLSGTIKIPILQNGSNKQADLSLGIVVNKGDYDASTNLFPTPAYNGYQYFISVAGILGGRSIDVGAVILKKNNNNDQSLANWRIID